MNFHQSQMMMSWLNIDFFFLIIQAPEEVWDKIFDVNVKAAYLLSKEVLPHLRKRRGGSIVYISSIAGFDPLGVSIENDT